MALQKREKNLLIGLAIVAVASAAILYRAYNQPAKDPLVSEAVQIEKKNKDTPNQGSPRTSSSGGSSKGGSRSSSGDAKSLPKISQGEFEKHTNLNNCWVLIEGEVYDISNFLTEYVSQQQKAMSFCGTVGFEVGFIEQNSSLREIIKSKSNKKGAIG